MTTRQGEDYTTGCLLLDHSRQIVVDLSGQKMLDAYPKAIQEIEFVGQFKKQIIMLMLQMQVLTNPFLLNYFRKN